MNTDMDSLKEQSEILFNEIMDSASRLKIDITSCIDFEKLNELCCKKVIGDISEINEDRYKELLEG